MSQSKNKKTDFKDAWLENPTLYWARRVVKDKYSCYCVLCHKKFALSNMGRTTLTSHMMGKKHQEAVSINNKTCKIDMFLNNNVPECSDSNNRGKENEQGQNVCNIKQAENIVSQSIDENSINLKHRTSAANKKI